MSSYKSIPWLLMGIFFGNSRRYQSEHFYVEGNVIEDMKMVSAIILPGADTIRNVIAKSITLSGRYYFSDPTFAKTDSLYRSTINKIVYFYCKDSAWPILIATCNYEVDTPDGDIVTNVLCFPIENYPIVSNNTVISLNKNLFNGIDADKLTIENNEAMPLSSLGVSLSSSDGQISVYFSKNKNNETQVILCDIVGRVIQATHMEKDNQTIFTNLPSGYYVVAVKTSDTIACERIYVK